MLDKINEDLKTAMKEHDTFKLSVLRMLEYEKYGKSDSVKDLENEVEILSSYLPEEMSKEEIEATVNEVIAEINPESIKEMGKVMKRLNEVLAGKNADMSLASSLVKEKLSK